MIVSRAMKLLQIGPNFAALAQARHPLVRLVALALLTLAATACGDDEGSPDADPAACPCDAALPPDAIAADADVRAKISQQGLYADIATYAISPAAIEYKPVYELWSDGAVKRRWIVLPDGEQINTSVMDHWIFPVGTKLFKEFAAPDGKLLETRIVEVKPDGMFFIATFVWLADQSDAILNNNGVEDVLGTEHNVPNKTRCLTCHNGEPGKVLGFSAYQLSKDGAAPTLRSLAAAGKLTTPPPADTDYRVPGAGTPAQAALGYLHANCGNCHNPAGTAHIDSCDAVSMPGQLVDCMLLRLSVTEANGFDPLQTGMAQSLIGRTTHSNSFPGFSRLTPADVEDSAIYVRPNQRGGAAQMPPPYASEKVDTTGVAAIAAWINSLP